MMRSLWFQCLMVYQVLKLNRYVHSEEMSSPYLTILWDRKRYLVIRFHVDSDLPRCCCYL